MSFDAGGGGIANANDVALNNPSGNDALVYNYTLGKWQNKPSISVSSSVQASSYTLVLADAGTVIEMNSSSAITLTIPSNASVAFPVGTVIEVMQVGSGTVNIVAAGGVTIKSPASLTTRTQWSSIGLRKRFTDTWILSGDLT